MSFDVARAIFNQVDVNRDGTIDRNEFNQWASGAGAGAGAGYSGGASFGGFGGASSYESSAAYGSGGYGAGAIGSGAHYDSYSSSSSFGGADGSYESYQSSSHYDVDGGAGAGAGAGAVYGGAAYGGAGAGFGSSSFSSQTVSQTYPTDAQGLFLDSNPQIIRRPAAGGVQTYTQNIAVRFLQPPPVPPPGPLIIKEVRPPQPPPPPPLRIRQQAPPLPQPPPLILRERPPQPPASIASQTVIRRLAALPVPPRSVIIERLPPLPPRPRDIIIERWVPYGAQAKRRTIVQRAAAVRPYPSPRNVIIQYEPAQVRVVRQFQRLGVSAANPSAYVQQYGASLLDAGSLLQTARAAGVVEDISAPAVASVGYGSATYGQIGGGYDAGLGGGYSSYESSSFSSGGGAGGYAGYGGGFESSSSSFESSSYGGGDFGGASYGGASYGGGSYGGGSYGGGSYGGAGGFDLVGAAFRNIDANQDGGIDRAEFARFFQQGL